MSRERRRLLTYGSRTRVDVWTGEGLGRVEGGLGRMLESHDTAAFLVGKTCTARG